MTEVTTQDTILAVGIGNTAVQVGLFEACRAGNCDPIPIPTWHITQSVAELERNPLETVELPARISSVVIASVNRHAHETMTKWIQLTLKSPAMRLLQTHDFPIELRQREPHRVGTDRVAAAVAANALRAPDRSAIFVDAGTALTVNAIDTTGAFLGGAILPGIGVALSTLSRNTDQLPDLEVNALLDVAARPIIGRDTRDAICSGVFWGAVGAIRELSDGMAREMGGDPQRFVTGGFGGPLADALGDDAAFVPHLVLSGIAMTAIVR